MLIATVHLTSVIDTRRTHMIISNGAFPVSTLLMFPIATSRPPWDALS